jgi:hypothetical protein
MDLATVSIQCGHDVVRTVKAALDIQGGLKRLVRRGDTVLIKPNYGVPLSWQMGATTHPDKAAPVPAARSPSAVRSIRSIRKACEGGSRPSSSWAPARTRPKRQQAKAFLSETVPAVSAAKMMLRSADVPHPFLMQREN